MRTLIFMTLFMLLSGNSFAEPTTAPAPVTTPNHVQPPLQQATQPVAYDTTGATGAVQHTATNTTGATTHNSHTKTTAALTPTQLQQKHKQELDAKQQRLSALEQANHAVLSQNQELQLKNDNLNVQVQVLQSERSAQMFIYGAITLAVGAFIGFLVAMYISSRQQRRSYFK